MAMNPVPLLQRDHGCRTVARVRLKSLTGAASAVSHLSIEDEGAMSLCVAGVVLGLPALTGRGAASGEGG
jgi:hypothetical protein